MIESSPQPEQRYQSSAWKSGAKLLGLPLKAIYSAYGLLVLYVGWGVFGLLNLLGSAGAGLIRPLLPKRFGRTFGRAGVHWFFRSYLTFLRFTGLVRLDLTALDSLRSEPRLILAPNHPSLLDAVLVISRLPNVTCIMKASLLDNPVLGGGARLAGYVRNDTQQGMVKTAVNALSDGGQLLVFPEATRTIDLPVNEFKGVAALIAKRSGASVQMILLESNTEFLGKHWPFMKKPSFPLVYKARLGQRYNASDDCRKFVDQMQDDFARELGPAGHRFDRRASGK
jgi:1-acyl-sn-glycerol-3-phosphate acyltransferase